MNDLGKIAYDAYCSCREWKSYDGKPLPQWADVQADIKDAWRRAADAVVRSTGGGPS